MAEIVEFIFGLIRKCWPEILGGVIVIIVGIFIHREINLIKAKAYSDGQKNGVQVQTEYYNKIVAQNNKQNRDLEKTVANYMTDFFKRSQNQRAQDSKNEQQHQNKMLDELKKNPAWSSQQCSVTDEVLKQRNAIRADPALPPPTVSVAVPVAPAKK